MNRKLKLTLLATTVYLALSGCSSDDTEITVPVITPNAAPVLSIVGSTNVTLDENTSTIVNFNIADANDAESTLQVSYELVGISEDELIGNIDLNVAAKTLTYSVENVQEDLLFSVKLNVEDPEGLESEGTVTFNVTNSQNEIPELSFSGLSMEENKVEVEVSDNNDAEDTHTVDIPFTAADNDDDELTFSVSGLSGIQGGVEIVSQSGNSGIIRAIFDKQYEQALQGTFSFIADDRNQSTAVEFILNVEKTEVSPEIEIVKNEVSGGVIPFDVDEDKSITITFTSSDRNNDNLFISAELSNPDVVNNFQSTVTGNSLTLENFNVTENTIVILTLTATDNTGTPNVSDTVEINIIDTVNGELNQLNQDIDLEREIFSSMNSRTDELTLFNFYTDYLTITNQMTKTEKNSYLQQLTNERENEVNSIKSIIAEIEAERSKDEEDIDMNLLSVKLKELTTDNGQLGLSGIAILNTLVGIDSSLLYIEDVNEIFLTNNNSYSRYVGNKKIGLYSNEFVWEFLNTYEVLETVNFMNGECN
jgi:hypothetical protein